MGDKKNNSGIAIIGMAVSLDGARNLRDYWQRIVEGKSSASRRRGSLEPASVEPALKRDEPDADAALLSLSLKLIRDAFDDAGYRESERAAGKSCGIFLSFGDSSSSGLTPRPETHLRRNLERIAGEFAFIESNRINLLSSSSLVAIKLAMTGLLAQSCDVALAGGIHAQLHREGLSPESGACSFDAHADEKPASEDGGVVVLKRLADAERDGNRIYAVLKDIAIFEREAAQAEHQDALPALRRAYDESGVETDSIAVVEASAVGPSLIDRQELQLLARLFGRREALLPHCALGSVGAMTCAADSAVAGVIKIALSLFYKILLPNSGDRLDAASQLERTPFYLNTEARAWIHGNKGKPPRRAVVCDFGAQGASAHAIMEEARGRAAQATKLPDSRWPSELFCFSGGTAAELLSLIIEVRGFISAHPSEPPAHLAFTLAGQQMNVRHRLAVLASDFADLDVKLNLACEKLREAKSERWQLRNSVYYSGENPQATDSRVVFMFPGYGSYYAGMLADLCLHLPPVREWFDTLDEIFDEAHGPLPSQLLFPPRAEAQATDAAHLHGLRGGAQGGFTASLALHELLCGLGVRCDVMVGHSNGENAALVASGTIRFKTRRAMFELTRRYTAHDDYVSSTVHIPKGVFLGVSTLGGDFLEQLAASPDEDLYLAMDNCPHQVVLFGQEAGIEDVQGRIARAGGIALRLPLDRAYHTPLYEAQAEDMRHVYEPLDFGPGHTRIFSCVTAQPFPPERDAIRALAIKQWSSRVRFRETIENIYDEGVRIFIEVGPNSTLSGFVDDTLRGREHLTLAANTQRRPGLEQLQRLLAQLYVEGMKLNLGYLFNFRDVRLVALKPSGLELQAPEQSSAEQSSAPLASSAIRDVRPLPEIFKPSAGNGLHQGQPGLVSMTAAAQSVATVENVPNGNGQDVQVAVEPAHAPDIQLAILRGHFDLMQQFLASQKRIMASMLTEAASSAFASSAFDDSPALSALTATPGQSEVDERDWPLLLGRVIEMDAKRLYCERSFNLDTDSFLLDHALGRAVASDGAHLSPLPVMPFTMSMEILAEAACCLAGRGRVVTGIYNLRGHRWLMLERGSLLLGVLAELQPSQVEGAEDVHVRLFIQGATQESGRQLAFEGTVRLSQRFADAPPPLDIQVNRSAQGQVSASEFYQRYAFHGPCFQAIKRLRGWDAEGIEAELEAPAASRFFSPPRATAFQIPAGMLDATGQLVGLWRIEQGISDFAVFPFQAASFQQYAEPPAPATTVICRGTIRMKDETTSEAHFDMLDEGGRVLARLEGLQLRNYKHSYIPRFFQPQTSETYFSEPFLREETAFACRVIDSGVTAFLEESGGIWKRVLAHLSLDEDERSQWYALPEKGARRAEWLTGRVAAKDAVRQWAKENHQLHLAPTEIVIRANTLGQPFVLCPAMERRGVVVPNISISHKKGLALAAASRQRIGIDIETLDAHQEKEWLRGMFDAEELALLVHPETRMLTAMWCAREAAAKAAGTGLQGDSRAWRIVEVSPDGGLVSVAFDGNVREVSLHFQEMSVFAFCLER